MVEKEDVIPIAKRYSELVKAGGFPMRINKTYLFGSFAKGNPHKYSDIDVAFVVDNCKGDYYFDIVVPVCALRKNVDFRIEPHIIDPADDLTGLLDEVQRTGIEI